MKFIVFVDKMELSFIYLPLFTFQTNGTVENVVRFLKLGIQKALKKKYVKVSLNKLINRYLLMYRNTLHWTTKKNRQDKCSEGNSKLV